MLGTGQGGREGEEPIPTAGNERPESSPGTAPALHFHQDDPVATAEPPR